jgi:hypothetical protein
MRGFISQEIIDKYRLLKIKPTNIYVGKSNIQHMLDEHPKIYMAYKDRMKGLASYPDYVCMNQKHKSFDFYKRFDGENDYIKLSVRPSKRGHIYYARTMYIPDELPDALKNFQAIKSAA